MNDFLKESWQNKLDSFSKFKDKSIYKLDDLKESEWSLEFETLMRNRLVLGAFRYGLLGDKSKPKYNRVESMTKRLMLYRECGNLEHLVDVANLCLCEFVESEHLNKHFKSIDDGEHVRSI